MSDTPTTFRQYPQPRSNLYIEPVNTAEPSEFAQRCARNKQKEEAVQPDMENVINWADRNDF